MVWPACLLPVLTKPTWSRTIFTIISPRSQDSSLHPFVRTIETSHSHTLYWNHDEYQIFQGKTDIFSRCISNFRLFWYPSELIGLFRKKKGPGLIGRNLVLQLVILWASKSGQPIANGWLGFTEIASGAEFILSWIYEKNQLRETDENMM